MKRALPTSAATAELKEGDVITGTVRSLTDYGAFVDIGGVDALLHVGDLAWSRVNKPADVLSVGQQIEARVLKIDPGKQRISLGLKQLQPHPWDSAAEKYKVNERVRGTVTRIVDFGAFVELEPGVEGLIHISEMSWAKRIKKASDVVKQGDIRRSRHPRRQPRRPPHLARPEAGARRSLGAGGAEFSRRLGDRRPGHQPHQLRRFRAARGGRRGHDPRRQHQRRKTH